MKNKILIVLISLFITTITLFLFRGKIENYTSAQGNIEQKKEKIVFGISDWPGYLGFYIARDLGYFAEEGLDIEFKKYISEKRGNFRA